VTAAEVGEAAAFYAGSTVQTNQEFEKGHIMKALQIITATVAAGLAAAFLGGAFWAQDANIDPDRYLVTGDVITVVAAVAGALFVALAAGLFYRAVRPER
jgi:hypothetical protein